MTPSNYEMAHVCIGTAEKAETLQIAHIEAMAAQTYATLALVDAVNDMRSFVAEYLAAAEDILANQQEREDTRD